MDLTNLMKSLSINDKEEYSASNFKVFAAEINSLHTDIVFGEFSDQCMLIVTQYEKVGSLLRITKDQVINDTSASEPVFSVKVIFGAENIEQQAAARYIAEKLEIKKPLILFLNLRNYDRSIILTVVDVLSNISDKTN